LGEPIPVGAGRIRPRAPRPDVLGQLGQLEDVTELGRRPELALADRPRLGVGDRHQPIGDLLAGQPLGDLTRDLLGQIGQLVQALGGAPLGLGAAATGAVAQPLGQRTRLTDRVLDEFAGLAGQAQHDRLGLAGPARDGAADRPQLLARAARAVTHHAGALARQPPQLLGLTREHARGVDGQHGVGGIADVGLDHRRIDPHRAR
jgi:hypothetical protein